MPLLLSVNRKECLRQKSQSEFYDFFKEKQKIF